MSGEFEKAQKARIKMEQAMEAYRKASNCQEVELWVTYEGSHSTHSIFWWPPGSPSQMAACIDGYLFDLETASNVGKCPKCVDDTPACCCGHSDQAHLDEGGLPVSCWECWEEKERTREATWAAGPVRRYLHRLFNWHMWRFSRCMQCGIKHP